MKYFLLKMSLFFPLIVFSQEKGLTPSVDSEVNEKGDIYAVVVGISDYQDEGIPDLRFADKDAEAFANFLRSPTGGSLDEDHLKVLINEQATVAQFAMQLDWLWEVVQENDEVIIYFSGHGDVEKKSITQPGYLLCWDAPSRVYLAGGAMNVRDLNDVISTLSIQNKAHVTLITDACRAGKLSGSAIGGPQATAANLAKQYANEIKILSCQPDEYSLEGEQWGGGRGAFSYHLVDGLYGMADRNKNGTVSLMELRSYLEERVSEEVAPNSQLPMTLGDSRKELAQVYPDILKQLQDERAGQLQMFAATDSRGMEEEVLAAADSNVVDMYLDFKKSLADKNFLCDSASICADYYYEILSREPQLKRLHSSISRNYAAALQEDAQQVLNRFLWSDIDGEPMTLVTINDEYRDFSRYLQKAAQILGEEHYMYNPLIARSYWFKAYLNDESAAWVVNEEKASQTIQIYHKALSYQPNMPHAWLQMARLYGVQLGQVDSAEYYAGLAEQAVPNWTKVYWSMGNVYSRKCVDRHLDEEIKNTYLEKGRAWLERGLAIEPDAVFMLNELAYLYNLQKRFPEEQEALNRSLAADSFAITMMYKADGFLTWGKYKEAEEAFLWALEKDSTQLNNITTALLNVYALTGQFEKAQNFISSNFPEQEIPNQILLVSAKSFLFNRRMPDLSLSILHQAYRADSLNSRYLSYAFYRCNQYLGNHEKAIEWREKFIDNQKKDKRLDYQGFIDRGMIYLSMNRLEKANQDFQKAFSHFPDDDRYAKALSVYKYSIEYLYYCHSGEVDKAEEVLHKGMQVDSIRFLVNCFVDYIELYDPKSRPPVLQKIAALYPDNPFVHFHLAQYYSIYGEDIEAAFTELEKAFQRGLPYDSIYSADRLFLAPLEMKWNRWKDLLKKYYAEQTKYW